jgi:hypothetical protein
VLLPETTLITAVRDVAAVFAATLNVNDPPSTPEFADRTAQE